jgi:hypothetical protein
MSSTIVPFTEVLFRNKNILSCYFSSNNFPNFFGFWSNSDSSIIDWKKRNEIWEKIKKYNLEYLKNKTRELIENSKYNKMREIANKILKNTENQDLTHEKLPNLLIYPYHLKSICIKTQHCRGCLCKKVESSNSDTNSSIKIEGNIVKLTPKCSSKLVSNLLKTNKDNKNNTNGNDKYIFYTIFFSTIGFGLGTYYFYKKNK